MSCGEAAQFGAIDADAGALHARQHAGERQFDFGVQVFEAALSKRGTQSLMDFEGDIGVLFGRGAEFQVEPAAGLLVERDSPRGRHRAGRRRA